MKLLLNAGNVRLKIISGLKNIFRKNYNHFVLLLAKRNDLYLAKVIYTKMQNEYKILALAHEKKRYDDEFFYQEALYHFCRDRNLKKLPVFIALDDEMVIIKQFDFPKMPLDDARKAIDWEMEEWKKDYSYNYCLRPSDEFYHIQAVMIARKYLDDWRQIIDQQNLRLAEIFFTAELNDETGNFVVETAEDDRFTDKVIWTKIKQALYCLSIRRELILDNFRLTYLNWSNISIVIGVCMIVCSSFMAGFYLYNYYQMKEQQKVLSEQLYLKQEDKVLIEALKEQENMIKAKQEKLKRAYKNDVLLYPLLVNLSAETSDGVKLVSVSVEEKQVELKGKSVSYEALADYKTQLAKIKFINNIKVDDTKLNEKDNLIDFNIYIDEVRENE